jgi:predicted PurR-regulated permease PerM
MEDNKKMKREHIFLIVVLFFASLFFYLFYQILSPFLEPILWAIFIAIVSYPVYMKLRRSLKQRGILSAAVMTVLVVLVIVLPFSFLIFSLAHEVVEGYHSIDEVITTGRLQAYVDDVKRSPILQWPLAKLGRSVDLSQLNIEGFLSKNLKQISTFLFNQFSRILKGLSGFLIGFLLTLLSLYYFFKDGDRLFGTLREALPIRPKERDLFVSRFRQMVSATIYGGLLVAIVQGILGGLAFWVLGLPSPVLWGTAMGFLSLIPIGGTALIWVPTSLILLIQGAFAKGIILLAIGVFVISMVDNFLRPLLVGARTKIHPLLLFFSVLGGIQAFGMIGLIAGPLVATLCITLVEVYTQGAK